MADQNLFFTLTTKNKRIDNFYVKFMGIPENITNVLGRQVNSITRPNIRFDVANQYHRGNTYKTQTKIGLDPIVCVMKDDEESVTSMFLYAQMFRQKNKHIDVFGKTDGGKERVYTFGIKVEVLNSLQEVVESYILKDCFLSAIEHTDPVIADDTENEITVTIEYDNIEVLVFDQYLEFKKDLGNEV